MQRPIVHIVGAGFSGLAAAVRLSAEPTCEVVVHEGAMQAGGRRRSYLDETANALVDNGNYLLLSGDTSTFAFVDAVGAREQFETLPCSELGFVDMASGQRWSLRPNEGRFPWWLLSAERRAPNSRLLDYWSIVRMLRARPAAALGDVIECTGPMYERVWRPLLLAALNTDPKVASAALAAAPLRELLAHGGRGAHVYLPRNGLSRALIEPALRCIRRRGSQPRFGRRLQAIEIEEGRVDRLEFEHDSVRLGPRDSVVLAVPAHAARTLLPTLTTPQTFNATLTAHFAIAPPARQPRVLGVINGTINWIFAWPDRVSATINCANNLVDAPREQLASEIWREVAALTGHSDALPSWRIVRQRRATFSATAEEAARRPTTETPWNNLFLAGAYVQNGRPAAGLESTIRSGQSAAIAVIARMAQVR
jgi:squalene-associated FAD-dependent desaturase